MRKTLRTLTLLAAMLLTAGQAWAGTPSNPRVKFFFEGGEHGTAFASEPDANRQVTITITPEDGYCCIDGDVTAQVSIGSSNAEARRRTSDPPSLQVGDAITVSYTTINEFTLTLPEDGDLNVAVTIRFRETGDLELSKTLTSDRAADANQVFTFTVTLDDTTINGTYGDMTFTDGVATVTLKGGESTTATGLPTGIGYTITEAAATGFQLTGKTGDRGTISTTKSSALFTNTRETGDLELKCVVVSDRAADADQIFTFTVTLGDTGINGTYGDMTFTDGVATVTLKGGESATATGLPTDITHTVEQEEVVGFTTTKTGYEGDISTTKSEAEFTNTRETGDLELSKILVSDRAEDANQEFTFTVTLDDTTISGTYGDMVFTNGVATVTLKGGERAEATGLPTDITYKITEADAEGFELTGITNDEGTISTTASTAVFTNTRKRGDLTVSNTVSSMITADLTKDFSFTVTLDDETINGTYGYMTFTGGVATVTLKHNESKTATGLPTDITYTVTEASAEGFTTTMTDNAGTISTTPSEAAFTNTRQTGSLTVSNTVESVHEAHATRAFEFTVTLDDTTINGKFGDMTFTDGVATFTLSGGNNATTTLPTGIGYTVTEASAEGFTTTKTGDTGTISTTASTAAFTNTYSATGTATLKAKVKANSSLQVETFQFQLLNGDGDVLETTSPVNQNEEASFTTIHYTQNDTGDHTYTIRQVIPSDATEYNGRPASDGIAYDNHEETVTVTVTDNGDGTLTVTYDGNTSFSTPEWENKGLGVIELAESEITKTWGDADFTITVTPVCSTGGITYVSDNTACATVEKDAVEVNKALVSIKGSGQAKITVTLAADDNDTGDSKDILLTVNPKPVTIQDEQGQDVSSVENVYTLTEDQNGVTLTLLDKEDAVFNIPTAFKVDHVAIGRVFTEGKAATVFLPFAVDGTEVQLQGGTFHEFQGVDETKTPWEVSYGSALTALAANTPYIFLPNSTGGGKITVEKTGVGKITICTANHQAPTQGQWTFIGTYEPILWTKDANDPPYNAGRAAEIGSVYGFAAEEEVVSATETITVGQFVKVGSGASIDAGRAYLKYTAATTARTQGGTAVKLPETMRVVIGGNATGVATMDNGKLIMDNWYSLDGRKLNQQPTAPGVYIKGGKKVVITK